MPLLIRPYRHFSVQCAVTYNAGPVQYHGTIWNLSSARWRLSGDRPNSPGETLQLAVMLLMSKTLYSLNSDK